MQAGPEAVRHMRKGFMLVILQGHGFVIVLTGGEGAQARAGSEQKGSEGLRLMDLGPSKFCKAPALTSKKLELK